jgi:signal peptidase I
MVETVKCVHSISAAVMESPCGIEKGEAAGLRVRLSFERQPRFSVQLTMKLKRPAKSFRARACHWWKREILPLLILALVLFAVRSSLADWNDVPSGSMRPTILEGDRIFVNKLAYDLKLPFTTWHIAEWGNPQRGDIVVFFSPHDGTRLVKRVIGLPGDTIELRNNQLVLNGTPVVYQPIAEELLRYIPAAEREVRVFASEKLPGQTHAVAGFPAAPASRTFAPLVVPPGEYFMMGDNRDDSFDSRFYGPVKREKIVGRATAVVLSLDKSHYWLPRWKRSFTSLQND